MTTTLVIGNKNYSSWSMRAWLALRLGRVPFEEVRVPMRVPGWRERVSLYSPTGKVPVLVDDGFAVWDSLAIFEYAAERFPGALGWPADRRERARARSITAEMHAGFPALRAELPFNVRRRAPRPLTAEARVDVERVRTIWRETLTAHSAAGPFLFGALSLADAAWAPVVSRFVTYGVDVGELERAYMDAVLALEPVREWFAAAEAETEVIEEYETL